jgi:hypothetical protein
MGNMDVEAQTLQAEDAEHVGPQEGALKLSPAVRSDGMDGVETFLEELRRQGLADGHFLGLIHVLIGRRITKTDGTVVSPGLTWRALSDLLKTLRWNKDVVREIGLDPATLPPRDRQRFWYTAIAHAKVDSPEAVAAGDQLAALVISPAPGTPKS